MSGFVTDYISAFAAETGRHPTYDEYSQIMASYAPEQLPVISTLARGFATFDHWFAEVPSQTFTKGCNSYTKPPPTFSLTCGPPQPHDRNHGPAGFEVIGPRIRQSPLFVARALARKKATLGYGWRGRVWCSLACRTHPARSCRDGFCPNEACAIRRSRGEPIGRGRAHAAFGIRLQPMAQPAVSHRPPRRTVAHHDDMRPIQPAHRVRS